MYAFKALTDKMIEIGSEIEMQLETGWRKTGTVISAVNFNGVLWLQVVMGNQLEEGSAFRLSETDIPLEMQPLPYVIE